MPRELAELHALAEQNEQLAGPAALQADLVAAERRVRGRVQTTWIDLPDEKLRARLAAGRALIDFEALPVDWTEARLVFRQVTDILKRHDAIEAREAARLHDLGREPDLPARAARWFRGEPDDTAGAEMLGEVLTWALRPFLARAAEVLQQRVSFDGWTARTCPVCGAAPDLAQITPQGQRRLICARCQTSWATDPIACPFCGEADRERITSLATADGTYRVAACQTCQHYIKTVDSRYAGRPALPALDAIATLPLDAAVMQRGFSNED